MLMEFHVKYLDTWNTMFEERISSLVPDQAFPQFMKNITFLHMNFYFSLIVRGGTYWLSSLEEKLSSDKT